MYIDLEGGGVSRRGGVERVCQPGKIMGGPEGAGNTRPALDPPFLLRPGESAVHLRHMAPSRAHLILPTVARTSTC